MIVENILGENISKNENSDIFVYLRMTA